MLIKLSPGKSITLITKSNSFFLTGAVLKINDAYFQRYGITDAQLSELSWDCSWACGWLYPWCTEGWAQQKLSCCTFVCLFFLWWCFSRSPSLCCPAQLPARLLQISTLSQKLHTIGHKCVFLTAVQEKCTTNFSCKAEKTFHSTFQTFWFEHWMQYLKRCNQMSTFYAKSYSIKYWNSHCIDPDLQCRK